MYSDCMVRLGADRIITLLLFEVFPALVFTEHNRNGTSQLNVDSIIVIFHMDPLAGGISSF